MTATLIDLGFTDTLDALRRPDEFRAALVAAGHDVTRSDFDDAPAVMPKRYVSVSDATRIVPGANDLRHPMAGRGNAGGVARSVPVLPDMTGHATKTDDEDGLAPRDMRTEGQRNYMELLISWIAEKSPEDAAKARAYTDGMTERGRWEPGRGGNVSVWIDRLKAKNESLKNAPKAPVVEDAPPTANVEHAELIVRENKSGKPMPMYYAVEIDGVTKFYRVKAGTKPGWWWIDAQASDDFHSIRNVATKNTILRAIIDQGAEECARNYGRLIGSCGRCHRTLTDATSRANGIGPECEGKL